MFRLHSSLRNVRGKTCRILAAFLKEPVTNRDLRHSGWRWVILLLGSFICFGNYFVYDNPSALQTQIQDKLNINVFDFNLLYSVYSFPNIILPLFGGFLVDYIGVRAGILAYSALICTGQAVFALGCSSGQYWLALLGRIIFGLGGESQTVAQSVVMAVWFKDKELALAMGINVTIGRLGSVANDFSEPAMYNATGSIDFGLWIGFGLCGVSLLTGVVMCFLDSRRDRLLGVKGKLKLDPADRVKMSEIFHFSLLFWLISINCLVVYVDVMPFNNFAGQFYQDRFGFDTMQSDMIISITYGLGAIFCPLFGIIVDKIGLRAYFILASAIFIMLPHLIFVVIPDCSDGCAYSVPPLILLGLGYALYASVMWASIPLVVKPEAAGTAFGVATSLQNLGLAVAPLIFGVIIDSASSEKSGYFYVSIALFIVGMVGVANAIWLLFEDLHTGKRINSRPVKT